MHELTHLSLFSGIGGLDLAAEWSGFRTVGQCEWADYPTKVLEKHWPDVPRWRDIRTLTKESFYDRTGKRTVDIVSGGFPCQPFSVAGKHRGSEDDRYLWPEMLRVISELRPTWVVGENVAGIVNMALDQVYADLENEGYTVQAFIIPACAVDAPHRRDRCAIVAHCNNRQHITEDEAIQAGRASVDYGDNVSDANAVRCDLWGSSEQGVHRDAPCDETDPGSEDVANAESDGLQGKRHCREQIGGARQEETQPEGCCDVRFHGKQRPAQPRLGGMAARISDWLDRGMSIPGYWMPEPDIPRITTKKEHRKDRLQCLGNAVVPQQFYPVLQSIADIERGVIHG